MIINRFFVWIEFLHFGILTYSYCLYQGLRTSDNWILQFPGFGVRFCFWPIIDWGYRLEIFKSSSNYLQIILPIVSISLGWGVDKHFIKRKTTFKGGCVIEV